MNNMIIFCLIFPLIGCGSTTEYVKVSYPVLVCPAPPILNRPHLYINRLVSDDAKDYGKIAKYYEISLKQMTNYMTTLELIINRYGATSQSYEELSERFNMIKIEEEDE